MEDIIFKELLNHELTEAEKLKLEFWLNENPKHRKIYAQLKLAHIYPEPEKSEAIKEHTWNGLMDQLKFDENPDHSIKRFFTSWVRIAAAFFILGISAIFFLMRESKVVSESKKTAYAVVEKISQPGQKITSVLPDGSLVKMNAGTKIAIPEFFTKDKREVNLSGEAYFEVVKDASRPFIIHTEGFTVEVLGTSFNVKAYENIGFKGVAVKSGKVAVTNLNNQVVNLTKNEVLRLGEKGKMEKAIQEDEALYFGWTDQRMVFKDDALYDVLHSISNWYGVDIENSKGVNSEKPYTANYKNPVLEEVMESLSHVYNFKYLINGKTVTIN